MPTQKKRIGFLPRSEVQNLIEEICNHNKLSQSKVTGILVEEALSRRGILNSPINKLSFDFNSDNNKTFLAHNKTLKSEMPKNQDNITFEDYSIKDEIQMINDFIEFKLFKNIMNKNKKMINK